MVKYFIELKQRDIQVYLSAKGGTTDLTKLSTVDSSIQIRSRIRNNIAEGLLTVNFKVNKINSVEFKKNSVKC